MDYPNPNKATDFFLRKEQLGWIEVGPCGPLAGNRENFYAVIISRLIPIHSHIL